MTDKPKMQRGAEDKALKPAEDKAPVEVLKAEPAAPVEEPVEAPKAEPQPRFAWEATSADGKAANYGHWRVRVQQSGATGLWRPFVEYVGDDDYQTAEAAEKALERLLR